jgi:glucose-1-phosphatase
VKNRPPIELLVFDMGHVFVDFDWAEVCRGFCSRAAISSEQFKPILKHIGSLGYENGHISTTKLLHAINEQMAIHSREAPISEAEFHALWNATFEENPHMAALLQKLKNKYRVFLLSNTNESHWQFLDNKYAVSRHFEELVLSYEVGHSKPQPQIYQEVLKRAGVTAEKALFIDDLEANILAGAELGMNVIHFKNQPQLEDELRHFNIDLD